MDKQARLKERERGVLAQQIINNPLWLEAKEEIVNTMLAGWRDTSVTQEKEREKIWLMLNAAELAFEHIESIFNTGKLAERQLAERQETING